MKTLAKQLYVWVLLGVIAGIIFGHFAPQQAVSFKLLGDAFIKLIKMLVVPVIFCTITLGIAKMQDMSKVGRIAGKAILYFELVSTLALMVGLLMVNTIKPGAGLNIDPTKLNPHLIADYVAQAKAQNFSHVIINIIPSSLIDAFAKGDVLQVLFIAVLFGFACAGLGDRTKPLIELLEITLHALFKIIRHTMWLAPVAAFGAMAFTIGQYGLASLLPLLKLILCFYATCLIFIVIVLGAIAAGFRVNIFKLLAYFKEELLLVLGTSSSESALAPLMQKLERLGCAKSVVGLVVPTGYSFNLDGTNIYLTMAAIFIAQACNIHLSLAQELSLLFVAMLTSKGASGVTGAGFIALAATLTVVPTVPIVGLALILGIDRFMSEGRSLTNLIGNALATIIIAAWENELDRRQLDGELYHASSTSRESIS